MGAWLLSYGAVFPKLNPKPKYSYADAKDILVAMQNDVRLPRENITLDLLQSEYADVLSDYDIELPEGDTKVLIPWAFEVLAIEIFGTTYNNFFLLHLSTGARAMSQVMPHIEDPQVRSEALQQLWKGIVYVYALEGRPKIQPKKADRLRSWDTLLSAALPFNDTHFQKMLYLCHENYQVKEESIWWSVAENVVTLFENGGDWVFHTSPGLSQVQQPLHHTGMPDVMF